MKEKLFYKKLSNLHFYFDYTDLIYKIIPYFPNKIVHLRCSIPSLYHIIMCLKVVLYSINNFILSHPEVIHHVSHFMGQLLSLFSSIKDKPKLSYWIGYRQCESYSIKDLGLSQMNCFFFIQLEQSIQYVGKCHLGGRRNAIQTKETILLFEMNRGYQWMTNPQPV